MSPRQRLPIHIEEESSSSVGDRVGGDSPPPPPSHLPPPQMPDMAQFWEALKAAAPGQGEHNNTVGCSSANFFRHNSPVFDGSEGPMATDNWISNF
jgi:hypothetical protein